MSDDAVEAAITSAMGKIAEIPTALNDTYAAPLMIWREEVRYELRKQLEEAERRGRLAALREVLAMGRSEFDGDDVANKAVELLAEAEREASEPDRAEAVRRWRARQSL